jgi:hypothetical protein
MATIRRENNTIENNELFSNTIATKETTDNDSELKKKLFHNKSKL